MEDKSKARESAEFSAKSVEDALSAAAAHFGVTSDALTYDVLRDSTRSILGLVRTGEVTIRATAPAAEAPVQATQEDPLAPTDTGTNVDEARADVAEATVPGDEVEEAIKDEDEVEVGEDDARFERNPPELKEVASEVVATLLDKMGVLAAVEVVDRGGALDPSSGDVTPLTLNLVGDDLGLLIGRRGETLRDLQFISRLIISRKLKIWPNLVIDVESYKARRVEALQSLAERMADQVRRTGRRVTMEPMAAHERRIIHITLRDDPDVYTESTGQDDRRKVQILPK